MKEAIIALLAIIAVLMLFMIAKRHQYEKIIQIQDDVCYELLVEARDRLSFMHAMKLLSEEDYRKSREKLLEYTDRLMKAGRWSEYICKKEAENEENI